MYVHVPSCISVYAPSPVVWCRARGRLIPYRCDLVRVAHVVGPRKLRLCSTAVMVVFFFVSRVRERGEFKRPKPKKEKNGVWRMGRGGAWSANGEAKKCGPIITGEGAKLGGGRRPPGCTSIATELYYAMTRDERRL